MKNILVKSVMIPISDYVTLKEDSTLIDVFRILEKNKATSSHAHRDAIVVDENDSFKGKITMIDIFKAIEPNYNILFKSYRDGSLTKASVLNAARKMKLWQEPMQTICERGMGITVSEVMHLPNAEEFVQEDDSIEKALHKYVMGAHQPLIVKKGDQATGFLRFGDLFEIVRKQMLTCDF